MKSFKIIIKEQTKKNEWGMMPKTRIGKLTFDYKNEELDLKKGAILYFEGDYIKEVNIDGEDYISINPTNLICQK